MEYRVKLDWKEPFNDEDRPGWMRKKSFVPCDWENIYIYYKTSKTNGIGHRPKSRMEAKKKRDEKVCTMDRVDIGRG